MRRSVQHGLWHVRHAVQKSDALASPRVADAASSVLPSWQWTSWWCRRPWVRCECPREDCPFHHAGTPLDKVKFDQRGRLQRRLYADGAAAARGIAGAGACWRRRVVHQWHTGRRMDPEQFKRHYGRRHTLAAVHGAVTADDVQGGNLGSGRGGCQTDELPLLLARVSADDCLVAPLLHVCGIFAKGHGHGDVPPPFPFVYVELCVEYGAEAPKEADFWYAQRAAVAEDPSVGFAVTTDIQRALHPPDKQDVAGRVVLELRRLAYGEAVVSRGPELISSTPLRAGGAVVLHFSNSSLAVRAGIFVGNLAECAQRTGASSMVVAAGTRRSLNYTMRANTVIVECPPGVAAVHVNADVATCFLYGPSGLPAPPVVASCSKDMLVTK